jgi:hypothetical protein
LIHTKDIIVTHISHKIKISDPRQKRERAREKTNSLYRRVYESKENKQKKEEENG